jgi:hypothetical protein
MLQIIDARREHNKVQLSLKLVTTSQHHSHETMNDTYDIDDVDEMNSSANNDMSIDYTIYPEYSLAYFLYFLSKSSAFILYDDMEMLHTMTDYILFLLDALLQRCDTTIGLFYKGLLRSMKSSEDGTISSDREEKAERKDALKKLHVLVDLTYVILSQRASSLMICRVNTHVPLPEIYFKRTRYNALSYLPKDFKIKLKSITTATMIDSTLTHVGQGKRTSDDSTNQHHRQIDDNSNKKQRNLSTMQTRQQSNSTCQNNVTTSGT